MAVLQKIRSKGALLLIIIGFALFAFIAEEFVRSISTTANNSRQVAGEVCGKKLNYLDFQQKMESYKDALKFLRGGDNLTDIENDQAEDHVWQMYVNQELIQHEANKLGLTVTDQELQDLLNEGTSPMLAQTPFVNQQGKFDVNLLKNFLTEYDKMMSNTSQVPEQYVEQYTNIKKYWDFLEKNLRESLLQQKYQMLLSSAILSNPVEAKMYYEGSNTTNDILLAAVPLTAVSDNDIKVTDSELKAKYNENKELYRQFVESRDIRYVTIPIVASDKDKEDLNKQMDEYYEKVKTSEDLVSLVRMTNSQVPYSNIWVTRNALPADIQDQLDSVAVGMVKGPYYEADDNSNNIIKLVAKTEAPDSVECRMIQVGGQTVDLARKSADSIYKALTSGESIDSIAKKYNQTAQKQWIVSNQYENSLVDEDNAKMLNIINTTPVGQIKNMEFAQGNVILLVTDRRAMTTKYNVAVIKRPVTFSKDTYSKTYNEFSQFLANSHNPDELVKNAEKYGYIVESRPDLYSSEHYIANLRKTTEALRWVFNSSTKPGEISPLYECGDNDHLLVVMLDKIHKQGFRSMEDVKEMLTEEVKADKKADYIIQKAGAIKDIESAKSIAGAIVDTLSNVTFANTSYIAATGASENQLNGSLWNKKEGQFVGPVKGTGGVYYYIINKQEKNADRKFDERQSSNALISQYMRNMNSFGSDLYIKGKVVDKRYLFF